MSVTMTCDCGRTVFRDPVRQG